MNEELTEVEQEGGTELTGLLGKSLARSTSEIRKDRGLMIFEDLQIEFARKVDDLDRDIRRKESSQNREFDFSPGTTISLTIGKEDFDPLDILEKDHQISLDIRNMKIKRNMFAERYNTLFGEKYSKLDVD